MRTTSLFFHPETNGPKVSRLTFSISPLRDERGLSLLVGLAACANADVFSKKIGREEALAKIPVVCTIHTLPKYVADTMNKHQNEFEYQSNDFAWLSLRFL